jgi:chemotaxis protein CheD
MVHQHTSCRVPVHLHPGSVYASAQGAAVSAVLGSCVAVCLFDAASGVGGMSHYLLPRGARSASAARFGEVAVAQLLEKVVAKGAVKSQLCAKVFGGAWMNSGLRPTALHLGRQNVELAHEVLSAEGILVVGEDTGGERARRLVFHTDDGSALVETL